MVATWYLICHLLILVVRSVNIDGTRVQGRARRSFAVVHCGLQQPAVRGLATNTVVTVQGRRLENLLGGLRLVDDPAA